MLRRRALAALLAGGLAATAAVALAVPVLAGSAAYAVSETFQWRGSLEKKPRQSKRFYGTIAIAVVIGLLLNFVHMNPIKALFWSAVINGIVAVPVMTFMMILAHNPKVMGDFKLPRYLVFGGWIATAVMLLASLGMLVSTRP